jgi:spoIIIJ-associated protein
MAASTTRDPAGAATPSAVEAGTGTTLQRSADAAETIEDTADSAPSPGDASAAGDSGDSEATPTGASAGRRTRGPVDLARLEQEGEIGADYLEGLLDIADLDGDIDMDVEGERAAVSIVAGEESAGSEELRDLVGRNGEVLEALQELTRLAVLTATGERSRLMLDVNGYRLARREELTVLGTQTAQRVNQSREAIRLPPMSPFERKVVHDAVAAQGARSESEGEEPQRRVVVLPG